MSAPTGHQRQPMPAKFCNLDRLLFSLRERNLDGIVVNSAQNIFYLSGFSGIAHKSDEPRPYALVLSRHLPDQAILIVADYYLSTVLAQPCWIEDIRTFRAVMMPLDLDVAADDIDRFVPAARRDESTELRQRHSASLGMACQQAIKDLKLDKANVAFDDLRLGHQLNLDGMTIQDGYDPMMFARAIKTEHEIRKLKDATRLNEQAIGATIRGWNKGMTLREFGHQYQQQVARLGGFVRDPGGMVWAHPRGADDAITLDAGFDDFELGAGTNIMFDCHGTLDSYCWDGGKTWTVDDEPDGDRKRIANATANAAEAVINAMKPGTSVSQLQAIGRDSFRTSGVASPDAALIFFHGLGLSHMDIEQFKADGSANVDWVLEKDMVVPLHILYPGDESNRCWVEEIAHVGDDGAQALFSWGFEPITGTGEQLKL